MKLLLPQLTKWNGYERLEKSLVGSGFSLHEEYLRVVADLGGCSVQSLNDYFKEESRECVTSAGKTETNTRTFPSAVCYRSPYLDDLASQLPVSDPKVFHLSLFPPLREIDRKRSQGDLSEVIFNRMHEAKFREYADTTVIFPNAFDTKKGLFNAFASLAVASGFKRKGNTLVITSGGLQMKVFSDLGGQQSPTGLQFFIEVFHEDEPEMIFHVLPGGLLPGMEYYTIYRTPEECLHGLCAYNVFCTEFFRTLKDGAA